MTQEIQGEQAALRAEEPIPEPPARTIVAWWDPDGLPYAVAYRADGQADDYDEEYRWYLADNGQSWGEPLTWPQLLDDMSGWRGPSVLVSQGRLKDFDDEDDE